MAFENDIQAIDSYLDHQLSEDEVRLLESRLRSDAQFLQLFKRQQFIRDGMEGFNLLEIESELGESKTARIDNQRFTWMRMAAAFVLLIGATLWFFLSPSKMDKTIQRFYTAPTAQLERSDGRSDSFMAGMAAYADQDYPAAGELFLQVLPDQNQYPEAQYYLAHSSFLSGNYRDARSKFLALSQNQPPLQIQRASWFAILAGLKAGENRDQLMSELEQIIRSQNHFYQEQAEKLLEEIDK